MIGITFIDRIEGSKKHGLIIGSIVGFIFFDMVYTASIINYAIQSELNVYLLKAISKLVENKMYGDLDEGFKVSQVFNSSSFTAVSKYRTSEMQRAISRC